MNHLHGPLINYNVIMHALWNIQIYMETRKNMQINLTQIHFYLNRIFVFKKFIWLWISLEKSISMTTCVVQNNYLLWIRYGEDYYVMRPPTSCVNGLNNWFVIQFIKQRS